MDAQTRLCQRNHREALDYSWTKSLDDLLLLVGLYRELCDAGHGKQSFFVSGLCSVCQTDTCVDHDAGCLMEASQMPVMEAISISRLLINCWC